MLMYLVVFAAGSLVGGIVGVAYMFVKTVDAAFSDLSRTLERRAANTAPDTSS